MEYVIKCRAKGAGTWQSQLQVSPNLDPYKVLNTLQDDFKHLEFRLFRIV